MASWSENLEYATNTGKCLTVVENAGTTTLPWFDFLAEAETWAATLQAQGISADSTVMIVARTSVLSIMAIVAAWMAGAAVTVSAIPIRARRSEGLRIRHNRLWEMMRPDLVLGDADHLRNLIVQDRGAIVTLEDWRDNCRSSLSRHLDRSWELGGGDHPAVLQPTSGTTGFPKVAVVSYRCLEANHRSVRTGLAVNPQDDTFVSWLPLFHDMGLIGLLGSALFTGSNLVIADPGQFAAQPANWMKWCAEFGGTITAGPSFAYGIAAAAMRARSPGDLSRMRLCINGSEPVDVDTSRRFTTAGRSYGLADQSMFPVYGLAEATLAVTFPPLCNGLQVDTIDRESLALGVAELGGAAGPVRHFALLGYPLDGMNVKIRNNECKTLSDRNVGAIVINGASVIDGYLNENLTEEWFDTGDLGYMVSGQLVVCGRQKDVIVVAGRNIYPEEIETIVASVEGVWRGNVAVFGVHGEGREQIVIIAEAENPQDRGLARRIADTAKDYLDFRIADVFLIEPGTIRKTPSGKVSRADCRLAYEAM